MRPKQCEGCLHWYIKSKGWCSYHKVKYVCNNEILYLCQNIENIPKCRMANNGRGGVDNRKNAVSKK